MICRLSVLMLLATGLLPALPEAPRQPRACSCGRHAAHQKFVAVEVQTKALLKLGISGAGLTDVTRVTLPTKCRGSRSKASSGPAPDAPERLNQLGFFTCEVWTVGDQYIAAYHVGATQVPIRPKDARQPLEPSHTRLRAEGRSLRRRAQGRARHGRVVCGHLRQRTCRWRRAVVSLVIEPSTAYRFVSVPPVR